MNKKLTIGIIVFLVLVIAGLVAANAVIPSSVGMIKAGYSVGR